MARKIDTSSLSTGVKGMPIEGNAAGISLYAGGNPKQVQGLDFLMAAIIEGDAQLANALLTPAQQNGTTPVILWGCQKSGNNITAGAVYVPSGGLGYGEIYLVSGTGYSGGISGTPNTYVSCTWVPDPTDTSPNQTELSDGSLVSINNLCVLTFAYSGTANSGNLPDWDSWEQSALAQMLAAPVPIVVGASGAPAFGSGVAAVDGLYFYKKYNNEVIIYGDCYQTGLTAKTLFQLPSGYAPAAERKIGVILGLGNASPAEVYMAAVSIDTSGNVICSNLTEISGSGSSTEIVWFISTLTFVAGQ